MLVLYLFLFLDQLTFTQSNVVLISVYLNSTRYSSRATNAFYASSPTTLGRASSPTRYTQPPSVFAMRELDLVPLHPEGPHGGLKTVNLYDDVVDRPDTGKHVPPTKYAETTVRLLVLGTAGNNSQGVRLATD